MFVHQICLPNVLCPSIKTSIAGHTTQARRCERNRKEISLSKCRKSNMIKSLNLVNISPLVEHFHNCSVQSSCHNISSAY